MLKRRRMLLTLAAVTYLIMRYTRLVLSDDDVKLY
jgi:hypothetical protein